MNTYGHSGDLGDIVAALPTIRATGGGRLVIFHRAGGARESMKGKRFDAIKPLLEAQPYIESVTWSDTVPAVDFDFSTFRHDHILGENLAEWQARHFGVEISLEPWLTVPNLFREMSDRIIVARTARYQNWQFPWRRIVQEHGERILFVGMPNEHAAFCKINGKVDHLPTADLLEVAQVIAGSSMLIANQTAACWVGLGLGHPLVQEQSPVTRDSVIERPNAQYVLYGEMPRIPTFGANLIASELQQRKVGGTVTVVFPFFAGDKPSAKALAELIRDIGGVENHQCLLVSPVGTDTDGIDQPLREAFGQLESHTYTPTLSGWPHGPNEMFAEVAMLIARDPRFQDFLWLEPDCVVLPGWMDKIDSAYRSCGMPILGVSSNTVAMDSRQVIGRHIVGVAVYPKGFAQLCPLVKSLKQMTMEYQRSRSMPKAFDAYFGAYTVARNAETRLIQHFWRSSEFREEGAVIVAGKTVSNGVENIVSPDAVLLHGCKDASLLSIIRSRLDLRIPASKPFLPPPSPMIEDGGAIFEKPFPEGAGNTTRTEAAQPQPEVSQPVKPLRGKLPIIPPEQWNRGEDGLPIPPFMKGQPEWERQRQLTIGRLQVNGFKKLRDYARKNLKINTLKMTAEKIIEACVLAERKAGKEEWTQGIPAAATNPVVKNIPPQVDPMPQWGPGASPNAAGATINDAMRAKMLQLRQQRGLPVTA